MKTSKSTAAKPSFLGPIFLLGGLATAFAVCVSAIAMLTAPKAPKYRHYEFSSAAPAKATADSRRVQTTVEAVFDGLTETGQKAVFLLPGNTRVYCRVDERQRGFLSNVAPGAKVKITYLPRAETGPLFLDKNLVSVKILGKRP